MKAILKRPGNTAVVVEIENKISVFEEIVGGEFLTLPFVSDVLFLCNTKAQEEGKEKNFPFYRRQSEDIYGSALFVGNGGHNFRGLTDGEADAVLGILNAKEE
jgi:hypothetical protein